MCFFGKARPQGRAALLLFAGLVISLATTSAFADVVITSDTASASSSASSFFGGTTNDSQSATGAGNLSVSSSATNSALFDSASNSGSASISLTGPSNGIQTLSGSLSSLGSASSLVAGGSAGNASVGGMANLTPVNPLLSQYAYLFNATGTSTTSADLFNTANANANLSILGIASASSSSTSNFLGTTGTGPFFINTSGILNAGILPFSASVSGGSASTLFGASNASSVNFSLVLTPIPEPGTLTLLGASLLGLAGYGWRRYRRSAN